MALVLPDRTPAAPGFVVGRGPEEFVVGDWPERAVARGRALLLGDSSGVRAEKRALRRIGFFISWSWWASYGAAFLHHFAIS